MPLERLKLLWDLMRGQRLRYVGAIVAMICSVALLYLVPVICRAMLDGVIAGKELDAPPLVKHWIEQLGVTSVVAKDIWIASAAIVVISSLAGLFSFLKGRHSAIAAEDIARRLRDRLFDHLQHMRCASLDKLNTGDLVQRCTSDVETVRAFLATQVLEISNAIVLIATVLPIMLSLDSRMTLAALVIVPPIVIFAIVFFIKIKSAFLLSDEAEGRMSATLQENLTGIRVVRAFARQEFEREKFAERNAAYRDSTYRLIALLAWYWSLSDLLCLLQRGIVLLSGAYWVSQGALTVGTLYAFIAFVNMFLWPVRNLGRILTESGKTVVALGRLQEVLTQPREDEKAALTPATKEQLLTTEIRGEIAFENVSFGFTAETPVIQGVSFSIAAGQTLALLGPSGSGKSVLMQLLLRLYDHGGGTITVDGRDVREIDRKELRRQIGVVMQEPFLFSKSLRENLKLGRKHAADDEMIEATNAACIHEGIVGFEKGYDTLIGERGVTLSGGQRQRVAIARAILKHPSVLVLDDALSAVDTGTESLILDALKSRRGKHTTLVIAHRLSTLMHADKIVVLDKGRVIQSGTHHSLVKEDGLYQRLWKIQASLEEDLNRETSLEPKAVGS
jgi:ATP-binding cassette subfamily B protein